MAVNLDTINPQVRFTGSTNQNVLVTWEDTTTSEIFENHTTDFGATWVGGALGTAISAVGATTHQMAANSSGNAIVCWDNGASKIEENHTSDNGTSWGTSQVISGIDSATAPMISMSSSNAIVAWL